MIGYGWPLHPKTESWQFLWSCWNLKTLIMKAASKPEGAGRGTAQRGMLTSARMCDFTRELMEVLVWEPVIPGTLFLCTGQNFRHTNVTSNHLSIPHSLTYFKKSSNFLSNEDTKKECCWPFITVHNILENFTGLMKCNPCSKSQFSSNQ